ncbi:MAG: L-aspartate oxidase [Anaerolineae bacterium]|nr:L-aspartate oxidase [Anaerolineae bacterium]MDW8072179.1 L-aspartate oxidase [Anaerolineae bacterium]
MPIETDVLVIGCGIAGATAAWRLAQDRQRQVLVITRTADPTESNTRYAQGGIVGCGIGDSAQRLADDILAAGAGLSLPQAVHLLAQEGPALVQRLLIDELGVPFDRTPEGAIAYTSEGGHSIPRILHVGDATGRAIEEALITRLRALPNVTLRTSTTAVDLITSSHHSRDPLAVYRPITCHGAYALDRSTGNVQRILARATVLATGGLGRIYRYTTNPEGARGDGLAMAYRAGARVINAEYIQFHPTTLAIPGADNFLISEAVRGEGGRLYTPDGRHFMDHYAPHWGDLAPRDIVARAIHEEMITHGYPHVLLDLASHMDAARIRERFPTIYATCLRAGLDITKDPIPVVPAAHYFCGGILVDEWGRSTIEGLYAVGEVSCTGVHGANRLASTSLLEGLVWGYRAGSDIARRTDLHLVRASEIPPWQNVEHGIPADPVLIYRDQRSIQYVMWLYVGLARNTHRLARALRELSHLWETIDGFYRTTRITDELIGLRNMAQAAWVVTRAAWHNHQSRGTHYREDSRQEEFANLGNTKDSWDSPHGYANLEG